MNMDFVYERLRTPVGVKVELVSGGEGLSKRVRELMARQVYAENGRDDYRIISHLDNGAPILEGEDCRISLTHTSGLFAVATLAPTPGANLAEFSPLTALGIDAEPIDREQVLRVHDRFLGDRELPLIAPDDLQANILAWTAKEAVYKAMLTPGLDFQQSIVITRLPKLDSEPAKSRPHEDDYGSAYAIDREGREVRFKIYSFLYGDHAVTLAVTTSSATYLTH